MAAAVRLGALWAVAAGTLLLHALSGIRGDYLGTGYPLTPGLTVTPASLAFDAAVTTLPVLALAAPARHVRLVWSALPLCAGLWLWARNRARRPFQDRLRHHLDHP